MDEISCQVPVLEETIDEAIPQITSSNESDLTTFGACCKACAAPLMLPWVCCVQCNPRVEICTQCFSYGAEFGQHESDHPYTVVSLSFPLFEPSWTAAEELQLLEAIQECGIGNWNAVSQRMRTKTETECERHYTKCYIDYPHPSLPEIPDKHVTDRGVPIIFKLSDNPPRPPEGTTLWAEMGGYSAARNEFSVEFDNFAEMDICQLTNDQTDGDPARDPEGGGSSSDQALITDLKLAVVDVYRNCLKERQRRKRIIRDYGLINLRKWYVFFKRRFESAFSVDSMRPFMRLFTPVTFDKYLESLIYETHLKADIARLQEYRKNGIKRLNAVRWYNVMKQRRVSVKHKRGLLTGVLTHIQDEMSCQAWLAKQASLEASSSSKISSQPLPNAPRRAAPPLYIEEMVGYAKLNDHEKEFCASVRLVPEAYLDFSRILVAECRKLGYLKLAHARTLIKIDVNKTRKLYDFLILHGQINKDHL